MATHLYKHIYAEMARPQDSYSEVNVSQTTMDTNLLAANYKYVAIPWATTGGGVFAVVPTNGNGKLGFQVPHFSGHSGPIIDLAFNPFNDEIIASGSEDGTVRLWNIESDGTKILPNNNAMAVFKGHGKRIIRLQWNPVVGNCLTSCGLDNTIKVWDVSRGETIVNYKVGKDAIFDINWNSDGSLIVFPLKDKKLHVLDPRANQEVFAVANHPGQRAARAAFYDPLNLIVSTGSSQSAQRQIGVRDFRNPANFLQVIDIDSNPSPLVPFLDKDLGIVYTFSRGDGQIRYYHLESEEKPIVHLSTAPLKTPLVAFAHAPKYCVNTSVCEVDRFYTINSSKVLQATQLIVPHKNADMFQEEIYPETAYPEPALDIAQWMNKEVPNVRKFSLETPYVPVEGQSFSFNQAPEETVDSLKEQLAAARARIAELEAQLAAHK